MTALRQHELPLERVEFGAHKSAPRCANSRGHGTEEVTSMQGDPTRRSGYRTYTCENCGAAFESRHKSARYCGLRCSGIAGRRARPLTPWQERFWRFVPDPRPEGDACWEWTGARRPPDDYGVLSLGHSRAMLAHRASYFLHYEEIPPEVLVCHRCDNPPCVNPAHLFAGTIADNNADKVAKGRQYVASGEGNAATRLSTADVVAIRALGAQGISGAEIGRRFGITTKHACRIVKGKSRRDG